MKFGVVLQTQFMARALTSSTLEGKQTFHLKAQAEMFSF